MKTVAIILIILTVLLAGLAIFLLIRRSRRPPTPPMGLPALPPPPLYLPRPHLRCISGIFEGRSFPLERSLCIGRDPNRCGLVYPFQAVPGISAVHCVLMVDGNTVWLKDLCSTYGTFYSNDGAEKRKLAANEAVRLSVGARIWIGNAKEEYEIVSR